MYVFSLFRLRKLHRRGSSFVRLVARTCVRFSTRKNCNARAAMSAYVFSLFRLQKLHCRSSNFVRSFECTCFRFSACKNRNARAAMPAAGQAVCTYVFSLFQSQKSHRRGSSFVRLIACTCFRFSACKFVTPGQLCKQLVKPFVRMCFRFFNRENCIAGAAALSCFCFSAC